MLTYFDRNDNHNLQFTLHPIFFFNIIYLFLAVLGLCCFMGFSLVAVRRLLVALASAENGSIVVAHGLSSSEARGIFLDQGLNLCVFHWQTDALPLSHQGSAPLPPICNNVKSAFVSVLFPSLSYQLSCAQLYLTIITADFLYCTVYFTICNMYPITHMYSHSKSKVHSQCF